MIFSPLFRTWKDSLSLLCWQNLKLFLLVSIKTWLGSLAALGSYFFWLYALLYWLSLFDWRSGYWQFAFIYSFSFLLPILFTVRPSLERKDGQYFLRCVRSIPQLAGVWLAQVVLMFLISTIAGFLPVAPVLGVIVSMGLLFGVLPLLLILSSLFFLDSEREWVDVLPSCLLGLKAFVYYKPMHLIWLVLLFCVVGGTLAAGELVPHWTLVHVLKIIRWLFVLFWAGLLANYYIKIKHSNYQLFFEE